jgi:hypothetical protein
MKRMISSHESFCQSQFLHEWRNGVPIACTSGDLRMQVKFMNISVTSQILRCGKVKKLHVKITDAIAWGFNNLPVMITTKITAGHYIKMMQYAFIVNQYIFSVDVP